MPPPPSQDGPNRETPVVAVTGDTTREQPEYVALGFDGYANKPISLALVRQMLGAERFEALGGEQQAAAR